jgi:hypothetical protein
MLSHQSLTVDAFAVPVSASSFFQRSLSENVQRRTRMSLLTSGIFKTPEKVRKQQVRPFLTVNLAMSTAPSSSSASSGDNKNVDSATTTKASKAVKIWVHLLSVFVVLSYFPPLTGLMETVSSTPSSSILIQGVVNGLGMLTTALTNFISMLPTQVWSLIHALSGMVFGGSILCTTFVEWIWPDELQQMIQDKKFNDESAASVDDLSLQLLVNKMATKTLFPMEGRLVLPGVTGSMVSGIAQSFGNYGSLRLAPRHVKSSLHVLFLFGLWWAWTDRKSQDDLLKLSYATSGNDIDKAAVQEEIVSIWKRRRVVNVISCLFIVALYGIMIIKPGY